MVFKLSKISQDRLLLLHPDLAGVVRSAISITPVDFGVSETLRTKSRQLQLVNAGASWTVNSKHLAQEDGYSHAVDLFAWVNGQIDWSMDLYYKIADAMKISAIKENVPIRWGGAWSVANFTEFEGNACEAQMKYIQERIHQKRKYTLDAVHFELVS